MALGPKIKEVTGKLMGAYDRLSAANKVKTPDEFRGYGKKYGVDADKMLDDAKAETNSRMDADQARRDERRDIVDKSRREYNLMLQAERDDLAMEKSKKKRGGSVELGAVKGSKSRRRADRKAR